LKQLLVLVPGSTNNNNADHSDDEPAPNLEMAKNLTGYIKVCQLTTEDKPQPRYTIDEKPKRR
jgi:hypothetical protein